jgi:ATP-dependent Clp protease ATP-binding subunit ClpC
MFDQLDKDAINQIIDIELGEVYKRIEGLGYHIRITDEAKEYIASKGYDVQFGARPLKRAIQKYVEDVLAEIFLEDSVKEGDSITIGYDNENDKMTNKVHYNLPLPPPEGDKCVLSPSGGGRGRL